MPPPQRVLAAVTIACCLAALPARSEVSDVSSVDGRVLSAQPGDALLFVVGDRIAVARVDRGGIWSRGIRLVLSRSELRGRVAGQRVVLTMGPDHVGGRIGAHDVSMAVTRSQGFLDVAGRFGAGFVNMRLGPGAVTADVGPCHYDLVFRKTEYVGQVGCGGQPEAVRLRVPAALSARGDVELAALIAAVLAR